jgi:prepilin-type processing-associated H-X9-DG protein
MNSADDLSEKHPEGLYLQGATGWGKTASVSFVDGHLKTASRQKSSCSS